MGVNKQYGGNEIKAAREMREVNKLTEMERRDRNRKGRFVRDKGY